MNLDFDWPKKNPIIKLLICMFTFGVLFTTFSVLSEIEHIELPQPEASPENGILFAESIPEGIPMVSVDSNENGWVLLVFEGGYMNVFTPENHKYSTLYYPNNGIKMVDDCIAVRCGSMVNLFSFDGNLTETKDYKYGEYDFTLRTSSAKGNKKTYIKEGLLYHKLIVLMGNSSQTIAKNYCPKFDTKQICEIAKYALGVALIAFICVLYIKNLDSIHEAYKPYRRPPKGN